MTSRPRPSRARPGTRLGHPKHRSSVSDIGVLFGSATPSLGQVDDLPYLDMCAASRAAKTPTSAQLNASSEFVILDTRVLRRLLWHGTQLIVLGAGQAPLFDGWLLASI